MISSTDRNCKWDCFLFSSKLKHLIFQLLSKLHFDHCVLFRSNCCFCHRLLCVILSKLGSYPFYTRIHCLKERGDTGQRHFVRTNSYFCTLFYSYVFILWVWEANTSKGLEIHDLYWLLDRKFLWTKKHSQCWALGGCNLIACVLSSTQKLFVLLQDTKSQGMYL